MRKPKIKKMTNRLKIKNIQSKRLRVYLAKEKILKESLSLLIRAFKETEDEIYGNIMASARGE